METEKGNERKDTADVPFLYFLLCFRIMIYE